MKKLMLAGAMLCTSLSAFANGVAVTPDANDPIVTKFAALGVTVKQINPSPVAGLKELITNKWHFLSSRITNSIEAIF